MINFRHTNKKTLLLWSLILSLAILFAQGTKLHVHDLGPDHKNTPDHHQAINDSNDPVNLSKLHFSHDNSHSEHLHDIVAEVDASPTGLLKNSINKVYSVFFLVTIFSFFLFFPSQPVIQRRLENTIFPRKHYALSHPLRAPPQH